jgi:hypothetical protein
MTGRSQLNQFTHARAARVFARLIEGRSLLEVCAEPNMPSAQAVIGWTEEAPAFRQSLALARALLAERLAAEVQTIADGALGAAERDDGGGAVPSREALAWAKLRIDARKWRQAVLAPEGQTLEAQPRRWPRHEDTLDELDDD